MFDRGLLLDCGSVKLENDITRGNRMGFEGSVVFSIGGGGEDHHVFRLGFG
jgi:hypothetical protein